MKSYQSGPRAITCIHGRGKNLANAGNRRDMDRLHR
jgi:hypothetical protein